MVVKSESAIGAKGAIQTMKNKQFTVAELQEAINKRLSGLAGRKYEGTEFHSWINGEIAAEFEERGITELCPSVWGIKPDMIKESGVSLYDDIAKIKAELKRDKRYKWSAGRGVLLSAAVEFREELLPLSLDGARRFILNEQREKMVKNCAEARDEALKTVRECEAELERLKGLAFPFFPLQSQFHCSLVERFVFEVDFSQDGLTAFAPVLEGNARNLHGKKFKSGLCFGSRSGCGGFCFRRPRIGGGCNMCGCICFRSRRGGLFRFRRRRRGRGRFFFWFRPRGLFPKANKKQHGGNHNPTNARPYITFDK